MLIDELLDIISTITATSGNDRLIVCGDANLPGLPGSSNIDADLHEALESVGLHQQVAQPTRGDNVLDILATSDSIPTAGIVISDAGFISDHRMILTSVPAKVHRTVNVTRKSRNLSKINCLEFERKLFESELFSSPANNVDDFCEQLASVVTRELDRVAPLKVSSKRKSKPITRWLTPEAIKAKRTRRRLERRWKATRSEDDRKEYRKSCRSANKVINSSRSDYMKQRLADCANPGERWKAVKDILHMDNTSSDVQSDPDDNQRMCMLLAGFALRNIPKLEVAENIDTNWSGALRSIALTIILIVAGLGLDPVALRRLSFGVLRLAFTPCVVETCTVAVSSHFLLDLPWSYAFILGFVLSAVSPAVVVPSLLSLTERGYGVEKGIPTLVIAAASVDDVICITGFGVALGITFSTGNLVLVAFKGPIEAVVGILYGIIVGVILWYIPHANHKSKLLFRFLLMISSGLFALFGSQRANISGAGPLAVLTLAFVAQLKWRKETDQAKEMSKIFEILWAIFKPLLFGLIGAEVYLEKIQPAKVGIGLAVLGIGLVLRMVATFLAVFGNSLNMKEKLFTTVSWIPKATVQAAIGGVALDTARAKSAPESEIEVALQIVTIAALAIVVTAPIGAILISLLGPRLLQKSSPRGDEVLVEPELHHPAEKTLLEENHKVNDISSV